MSEKFFNFPQGPRAMDGKVRFETRSRHGGNIHMGFDMASERDETVFTTADIKTEYVWEPPPKPVGTAYRDPFAGRAHDGPTLDGVPYKVR